MRMCHSNMVVLLLSSYFTVACSKEVKLREVRPSGGVLGGGETVEIIGSGFSRVQGVIVYFGSQRAPHAYIEGDDKIVVTTPAYGESTLVDVRVITDDGQERILRKGFMYVRGGKWSPLDAFGAKKR